MMRVLDPMMNENVRSKEETKETPFNNVTSADVTLFVHQRALCSFANGSVCLQQAAAPSRVRQNI